MKPLNVLFLYLLFASIFSFTQSFTVDQVMSSPFPSQLTSAKQAEIVGWVFNNKGSDNVWVAVGPDFLGRQITHYAGDDGQRIASLKITSDGRTILYARGSELNGAGRSANPLSLPAQPKQQVWSADVDRGEPRLLGDMGCEEEGCEDIQISSDGKYAVWETKHQLWIARVNGPGGATSKQLTDVRGELSWPQWSPDCKRIAFRVDRKSHSFVAIADLTPNLDQALTSTESADADKKKDQPPLLSAVHYLSPSAGRDLFPRWSPDGKQIAFDGAQYGKPWKIFLISAQGGTPQELLSENRGEFDPSWSSDGKQIAFGRVDVPEAQVINVLDLQTHQFSPLPGSQGTFSPRWSPDGHFLAALSSDSQKLLLYDFKTQKWTNWLSEPRAVGFPTWSRDSKYLYFDSTFSNDQSYRRLKVGETKPEQIVSLKDIRRFANWIGSWSGLAPDGTPLFVRDISTQEIYALDVQFP